MGDVDPSEAAFGEAVLRVLRVKAEGLEESSDRFLRRGLLGHVLETEEMLRSQRAKMAETATRYRLLSCASGSERLTRAPKPEVKPEPGPEPQLSSVGAAADALLSDDHAVVDGRHVQTFAAART